MNKDLESIGFSDFSRGATTANPDFPLYPSLMSQMKVDLAVSPKSDVWMVHEHPLPEIMKWVEYDIELATLTLVSISGKIQDFGMKVPPAMKKYLSRATQIYAIHQGETEIKDMSVVPLVVRDPLNNVMLTRES